MLAMNSSWSSAVGGRSRTRPTYASRPRAPPGRGVRDEVGGRTSSAVSAAPTSATIAAISRMWLRPGVERRLGEPDQRRVAGPLRAAERHEVGDVAAADGRRAAPASATNVCVTWCWKIAPQAAMPVATPTCRNVELMPDAMPERRGSTTPIAAVASAGFVMPMPPPAIRKPASSAVQSSPGCDAAHQQQADAHERQPAA